MPLFRTFYLKYLNRNSTANKCITRPQDRIWTSFWPVSVCTFKCFFFWECQSCDNFFNGTCSLSVLKDIHISITLLHSHPAAHSRPIRWTGVGHPLKHDGCRSFLWMYICIWTEHLWKKTPQWVFSTDESPTQYVSHRGFYSVTHLALRSLLYSTCQKAAIKKKEEFSWSGNVCKKLQLGGQHWTKRTKTVWHQRHHCVSLRPKIKICCHLTWSVVHSCVCVILLFACLCVSSLSCCSLITYYFSLFLLLTCLFTEP